MNFFEAMDKMYCDKCDMLCNGQTRYRLDHQKLYAFGEHGWRESATDINKLLKCSWEIYEEPKESKGLWEKPADENSDYFGLRVAGNLHKFAGENDTFRWGKALNTFMCLKGHPLAVKATAAKQFFIKITDDHVVVSDDMTGLNEIGRSRFLSPFFDYDQNAGEAIHDIGEDKLLHMFKTFQGIYE